MKKNVLFLWIALFCILTACAASFTKTDQETGVVSDAGPGGMSGAMATEYINKQERAFGEVIPQTEEVYFQRDADRLLITLKSDILFDTNSTELKTNSCKEIHCVADVVNKYPETRLVISGHTDSTGSEQHNMKLSEQRALAVKKALEAGRVASQRITAQGFGESSPILSNATEHGKELNRRVTIEIIPNK